MTPPTGTEPGTERPRPRVEGDREQEILAAALVVLADVGYDRLTMDAVASRAHASKATLYRRWNDKATLLIDALTSRHEAQGGHDEIPDTGSLRGDLVESFCGMGGLADADEVAIFASVLTAITRDEEFAAAFRRDFIGPKADRGLAIFERAKERGEIAPGTDLSLIVPALPGIVLHRLFLLGERPTAQTVIDVIDQIILPAATHGAPATTPATNSDARTSDKDPS